jgi:CheY-like chemotaxis protein
MSKRTILLVDDDEPHRQMVAACLNAQGFAVVHAGHGGEALQYLEGNELPDAIVLDVEMPVMDGQELLRALGSNPDWSAVPAIVVSGSGDASLQQLDGAKARFRKPLDLPVLLHAIDSCCKRAGHGEHRTSGVRVRPGHEPVRTAPAAASIGGPSRRPR